MVVMDYIIPIAAIFMLSAVCSMTRKGFSAGIFMACVPIGISVLVWLGSLPFYAIIVAVVIILVSLFGLEGEEPDE